MNCRKLERNSPREIRRFIERYINTGEVWHLLFVGKEGRKKSSVPRAICDELGAEVMELSCTNQTTPEKIQNIIDDVLYKIPLFGMPRVLIINEFDKLPLRSQGMFNIPLEKTNIMVIITTNNPENIIGTIDSRCWCIDFDSDGFREFREFSEFRKDPFVDFIANNYPSGWIQSSLRENPDNIRLINVPVVCEEIIAKSIGTTCLPKGTKGADFANGIELKTASSNIYFQNEKCSNGNVYKTKKHRAKISNLKSKTGDVIFLLGNHIKEEVQIYHIPHIHVVSMMNDKGNIDISMNRNGEAEKLVNYRVSSLHDLKKKFKNSPLL